MSREHEVLCCLLSTTINQDLECETHTIFTGELQTHKIKLIRQVESMKRDKSENIFCITLLKTKDTSISALIKYELHIFAKISLKVLESDT